MAGGGFTPDAKPSNKPRLSFWQIWNMSFGFLGVQFGFALQNANVSRIFQSLGADVDDIPILWIAAPVTGLIIQPIIGHMSDHTWNRLGRRRPYFLFGAIFASAALIIMPNSPVLWVAAGMLWIMDASINISMEPFRAFVGDMLPAEQRTKGFAMQSFFIGIGAVVASALPQILDKVFNVAMQPAPGEDIAPVVTLSFYIGSFAFFFAVLWTVLRTKEYSPEQLESFQKQESEDAVGDKPKVTYSPEPLPAAGFIRNSFFWIIIGLGASYGVYELSVSTDLEVKELYILTFGFFAFGVIQLVTGMLTRAGNTSNGFVEVVNDLFKMPKTMGQLAFVQFFSWFALFSMWIYTTSAVTSHIYGTSDTSSVLYNQGANWVGVGFAVYNGVAIFYSFLLAPLSRAMSRKKVHMMSLIIGGVGLASIYLIKDPNLLLVSMIGVGIAWTSILAIPYAILTGSLPVHKLGVYMGIFNFFIVIPQITAASVLGLMVRNFFGGQTIYALITGGVSMVIAAILVMRVDDVDEEKV